MRIFIAERAYNLVHEPVDAFSRKDKFTFQGMEYNLKNVLTSNHWNIWSETNLGWKTYEEIGPAYINMSAFGRLQSTFTQNYADPVPMEKFGPDKKERNLAAFKKALRAAVEAGVSDQDLREAFWMEGIQTVMNS